MKNNIRTKHFHIPLNLTDFSYQKNDKDKIRELLKEPALILKRGGLIAFPTETVYGLGASIYLENAVKKIFEVKGRPQDNPLIAHIGSFDQIFTLAKVKEKYIAILQNLMPGPITFVLEAISDKIPNSVRAGLNTIAVRMPDNIIAQELINLCGSPVVAPSANISGKPSCTSFEEVVHDFDGKIEGIINGGHTHHGIESTVVSLAGNPVILRPGIITKEDLLPIFLDIDYFVSSASSNTNKPSSPGMKYKHYTPEAIVLQVSLNNMLVKNKEAVIEVIQKIIKKYKKYNNASFSCLFNSDICCTLFNQAFQHLGFICIDNYFFHDNKIQDNSTYLDLQKGIKINQTDLNQINHITHNDSKEKIVYSEYKDKMIKASNSSYRMTKYSSIYDFAKAMYSQFRFADNNNIDIILVEGWSSNNFGFTVMNRLNKAATDCFII